MSASLTKLAISALLTTGAVLVAAQASGSGTTTRYWDCCKPSCAWNDLSTLGIDSAVKSCNAKDQPLSDTSAASGCSGGSAYMCSDQSPWAVSSDLAYGFAAVSAASPKCCQCYKLSFTSGAVRGKTMVVQATNTGSDVRSTQFDLAMPGGGFGIFNACKSEWGATSAIWGAQYGGSFTDTCSSFPAALRPGCELRWGDFFQGSDNPTVNWEEVSCPVAITAKSGCVRTGDTPSGPASAPSAAPTPASTPVTSSTASASVPVSISAAPSSSTIVSSAAPASSVAPVATDVPAPVSSSEAPLSTSSTPTPTSVEASSSTSTVSFPTPTETDDDACEL